MVNEREIINNALRVCRGCLAEKNLSAFVKSKASRMGRRHVCKTCSWNEIELTPDKTSIKKCKTCGVFKKTSSFDMINDRYRRSCKDCLIIPRKECKRNSKQKISDRNMELLASEGKLYCPGCSEEKLSTFFRKNSIRRTGFDSWCKSCKKQSRYPSNK